MKLTIIMVLFFLLVGCATLCPCPDETLYFTIRINPAELGCGKAGRLYQFVRIPKGELAKGEEGVKTLDEVLEYIRGNLKVTYQVVPVGVAPFTEDDLRQIKEAFGQ